MVHPQCRGYVHRTAVIFNFLQTHSFDLCTQLQISSITQSCALSCRSFLPKPSVHSAAEVVNTLSWDLTLHPKILCTLSCKGHPHTQLGLNLNPKIFLSFFASNYHHTQKPSKSSFLLYISAYLYKCTITIPCV